MRADGPDAAAPVVANQHIALTSLRSVFDRMDGDLVAAGDRERRVAGGLEGATSEADALRARLLALGATVREPDASWAPGRSASIDTAAATAPPRYDVPSVPRVGAVDELVPLARAGLREFGVDPDRDPLLQVLPAAQLTGDLERYADEHGDVTWNETDWAVVIGAGLLATVLDIVLVRIPADATFLGRRSSGSPLTRWLQDRDRAGAIHDRFLKPFERSAKVPYDAATTAATGGLVSGMRPATHRLQSFGHDPVLGFLVGVADIMHGTGTYVDQGGAVVRVATGAPPVDLITALLTQVRHLLSDVATPAGLQPPLFTLLQLGRVDSPFALGPSGERVPWTDVARRMYTQGYDLRHSFSMGVSAGVVDAVVGGYRMLDAMATGADAERRARERAKLTSMLLFGHAIAASGTLLKTGLVFGMNPAALNLTQLLALAPATVAWLRESSARDRRVVDALGAGWRSLAG